MKVPTSLQPGGTGDKELQAHRDYRAAPPPIKKNGKKKEFTYSAYKEDDVRLALETLFHGKCAYCETVYSASAPVDIEHFRPKGGVAEDPGHGGYWWIAARWDNLLPSCIDCNRKRGQVLVELTSSLKALTEAAKPTITQAGKQNSFPLCAGGVRAVAEAADFVAEQPLLLNPCDDEPNNSLGFSFDPSHPTGIIIPVGDAADQQRGTASIFVYGLNRLRLVEDRTRVLRRLEYLGDLVIDLATSIEELEAPEATAALAGTAASAVAPRLRLLRDRTLVEMKSLTEDDAPYATMARAWMSEFKAKMT